MMFSVFCPTHDARVLMTRRNVAGFWNGPDGPAIAWTCTCGHQGILDRQGSRSDAANCATVDVPTAATTTTTTTTPTTTPATAAAAGSISG